jgi:hypothetical protein
MPAGADGVRILHLSDMHFRHTWHPAYDELMVRMRLSPPDLVVMTGDFVDDKYDARPGWALVEKLIPRLRAKVGMFAVHGNHDGDFVAPRLASMGVAVLTGRRAVVPVGDAQVELIGLPGTSRMDWDERFIRGLPPRQMGVPRIVLAHFPDLMRPAAAFEPDLFLCGHTHGGQVCLPGGLPLVRHDTLPRRLDSGVHRVDHTWLVVNRGTGFSSYPVRLFCPAEVVEINLMAGQAGADAP